MAAEKKVLVDAVALANLATQLNAAMDELTEAKRDESSASSRVCSARNRVNDLQKAIDGALAGVKDRAPEQSHWRGHK